jgi:hypothetical protein
VVPGSSAERLAVAEAVRLISCVPVASTGYELRYRVGVKQQNIACRCEELESGATGQDVLVSVNLINLERVSKAYGGRMLLSTVSLGIGSADRIGVVGRNGELAAAEAAEG